MHECDHYKFGRDRWCRFDVTHAVHDIYSKDIIDLEQIEVAWQWTSK